MNLTGKLLISMPSLEDERFYKTVIYMCAHSSEGAMGIIINKKIDYDLYPDLLEQLGIDKPLGSKKLYIRYGGPEIISFKEILERLLKLIDKKRFLVPFPLTLAKVSANFFELFPKPLLTKDQLRLLKYDNVLSGKYKSNKDLGIPSKRFFDEEVKKYCYMWKDGGQFSTKKYTSKK